MAWKPVKFSQFLPIIARDLVIPASGPHMVYINEGRRSRHYLQTIKERIMKLLLDNLFLLGQVMSLIGLAWGAWLVLRDSLIDALCPGHKGSGFAASLAACVLQPFRRVARV